MKISGWASSTKMDHVRHVVNQGAFTESIKRRGLTGPRGVRLLAYHDTTKPLGKLTKLEPRREGLWLEGEIEEGISYGKDIALATKAAGGLNYSVGFFLQDADIDEGPDGREYLHILKADLFEVSIVLFPCNDDATMSEVKSTGPLDDLTATLARMKLLAEELQNAS